MGLGTVQGSETFFGFQDRNVDYVPVSSTWDTQNTYLYRMHLVFLSSIIYQHVNHKNVSNVQHPT